MRAIITRGLYIITPFLKSISLYSRRFFQKIISLCMVSIKERFVIKSGLWVHTVVSFCWISWQEITNFYTLPSNNHLNELSFYINSTLAIIIKKKHDIHGSILAVLLAYQISIKKLLLAIT